MSTPYKKIITIIPLGNGGRNRRRGGRRNRGGNHHHHHDEGGKFWGGLFALFLIVGLILTVAEKGCPKANAENPVQKTK